MGSQRECPQCHLSADKRKPEPAGSTASRQSRSACHGFASVSLAKLPKGGDTPMTKPATVEMISANMTVLTSIVHLVQARHVNGSEHQDQPES